MALILPPASVLLLLLAVASLVFALIVFPRPEQARYRIEKVVFNDGAITFYPMRRGMTGWKNFPVEHGIRGYRTEVEARQALEGYLTDELGLEISETQIVKEYG